MVASRCLRAPRCATATPNATILLFRRSRRGDRVVFTNASASGAPALDSSESAEPTVEEVCGARV
jgi:hypothetical protein